MWPMSNPLSLLLWFMPGHVARSNLEGKYKQTNLGGIWTLSQYPKIINLELVVLF